MLIFRSTLVIRTNLPYHLLSVVAWLLGSSSCVELRHSDYRIIHLQKKPAGWWRDWLRHLAVIRNRVLWGYILLVHAESAHILLCAPECVCVYHLARQRRLAQERVLVILPAPPPQIITFTDTDSRKSSKIYVINIDNYLQLHFLKLSNSNSNKCLLFGSFLLALFFFRLFSSFLPCLWIFVYILGRLLALVTPLNG
jgi:hypothetical protein